MTHYLDSEQNKAYTDIVVRLTVVTAFGLIGTVVTGILGMNLFDEAANPALTKLFYFSAVFVPFTLITLYTIAKSKRLSTFLDALSDENVSWDQKVRALVDVWARKTEL